MSLFRTVVCLAVCLAGVAVAAAPNANHYPWEGTRRVPQKGTEVSLPQLMDLAWHDCGGKEGHVSALTVDGMRVLDWKIAVDHHNVGMYPVGWPSFEARPKPFLDFSGKGAIAFRMRALTDTGRPQTVRFILKHNEQAINVELPPLRKGDWQWMTVDLGNRAWLKEVDRIHFFICEDQYKHGDQLEFQIADFRFADMTTEKVALAPGKAGASLWLGARGDADSRIAPLPAGTRSVPAILHLDNRLGREIPASAEVRFRITSLFSGKTIVRSTKLGVPVPDGARVKAALTLDLEGVKPGYCHVLTDVRVDGASVLETCLGSDDLYLAAPGESETMSVLSIRLGMAYWVMDRIHGGFMHSTDIALPHSFDPFDRTPAAYAEFLRHFAFNTTKVCEGYEAGIPGLALAAEAYRRAGDVERCRFAETLLWNGCEAMLSMQDACGGVVTFVNELGADGLASGGPGQARNSAYNSDQVAEWMRGLVYATLYYHRRGGEDGKVRRLNAACRAAGNFIFAHTRMDSDGVPNVIRHFLLNLIRDGEVKRTIYHQEGRQCDVYQPRVLAGLSYTALALLTCGETVPEAWWDAFDASVRWMDAKMKPNGWFDWQCEDVVEGGCHTFLGNIYAGEGLFGVYLAETAAGRAATAASALKAARRAYRYVTDDCWIRGSRYQYPLEFWVGPYVYWLFTEWERHVGHEPAFADWLTTLDRKWRVERKWGDFLRTPGMDCGRARSNGMLTIAILGYQGIRLMEEIGQPWSLFDK